MIRRLVLIAIGVVLALALSDRGIKRRVKCALSDQNCSNIILRPGCEHVGELHLDGSDGPTFIPKDDFDSFGLPTRDYSYRFSLIDGEGVVISSGTFYRESNRDAGEMTIGPKEGRCGILEFEARSRVW